MNTGKALKESFDDEAIKEWQNKKTELFKKRVYN